MGRLQDSAVVPVQRSAPTASAVMRYGPGSTPGERVSATVNRRSLVAPGAGSRSPGRSESPNAWSSSAAAADSAGMPLSRTGSPDTRARVAPRFDTRNAYRAVPPGIIVRGPVMVRLNINGAGIASPAVVVLENTGNTEVYWYPAADV